MNKFGWFLTGIEIGTLLVGTIITFINKDYNSYIVFFFIGLLGIVLNNYILKDKEIGDEDEN